MKLIRMQLDSGSYLIKPDDIGEFIISEIENLLNGDFSKITLSVIETTTEMALEEYDSALRGKKFIVDPENTSGWNYFEGSKK